MSEQQIDMSITPEQRLAAKVESRNRCHAVANAIWPQLVAALEPFVGKPVETVQGPLRANVQKAIDALEMPYETGVRVVRYSTTTGLAWTVTNCVSAHGQGFYQDVTFWVGKLEGQILTELEPQKQPFRTDYTAEEVVANRLAYRAAKDAASEAFNKLQHFGEYDQ